MKLLAVVDKSIRSQLENILSCEADYYDQWNQIDISGLADYTIVLLSASCLDNTSDMVLICSIASQVRYFGVTGIFIDMPLDASSTVSRLYPQIKLATCRGNLSNLLLQLRTFAPDLFLDNPNYKNNTSSASANARRYEESSHKLDYESSQKRLRDILGSGVENVMTSAPLGLNHPSKPALASVQPPAQPEKSSSEISVNLDLNDISSVSSISGISGISEIIELDEEDQNKQVVSNPPRNHISSMSHQIENRERSSRIITIQRSINDIMLGSIEFGNLIRIIAAISRMKLTGILELQNETRSVRIEYRQGASLTPGNPQLIQSALCWTSGSYNFNSSRMLSINAQSFDLQKIIYKAVHELFLFNPLLRALEKLFKQYVTLTNQFVVEHYPNAAESWWDMCDGTKTLSDIFSAYGASLEPVSRDIYQAWLCDELYFQPESISKPIHIIYETAQPHLSNLDNRAMSSLGDSNPGESQLNIIRKDLKRVRASFDTDDGYTILGLKPGCGSKALDAAYYAWINRYHSDRFVRYKDPAFVKLANELVMLMNNAYAKLSKVERMNSSSVHSAINRTLEDASGSARIGLGRARLSTLSTEVPENDPILGDIHGNSQPSRSPHRASIRPASIIMSRAAVEQPQPQPQATPAKRSNLNNTDNGNNQVLKMSDVIASRQTEVQKITEPSQHPSTDRYNQRLEQAQVVSPSAVPEPPANVTPEQHFMTAKKKISLGLGKDALLAINWALKSDPENLDYNIHRAYAEFLVSPEKRDQCMEQLKTMTTTLRTEVHATLSNSEANRLRLFAPYYFTAKIQIAAGQYTEAAENLQYASRLNPTDVDTQRCLRYVTMQLEKQPPAPPAEDPAKPKPSGFFAMLKEKLNKPL